MTGPEHYAESERLIALAHSSMNDLRESGPLMTLAQVHATLALAAATHRIYGKVGGEYGEPLPAGPSPDPWASA